MIKKIVGKLTNNNDYKLSKLEPILKQINDLEPEIKKLSHEEIKKQTHEWKEYFAKNPELTKEQIEAKLNEILPRAYAIVRESARRVMNQRHRDVQILAGIALHQGKVAEQKTGEGKTLTATLPLYLNALTGRGAHLVTPNDYLSQHGAGWYGKVYDYLGISVGVIIDDYSYVYDVNYNASEVQDAYSKHLKPCDRVVSYMCDITYGTNSQFGFDYLRDNMATDLRNVVQRNSRGDLWSQNFAIVDEVDSILIDFARTPLIISTPRNFDNQKYAEFTKIAQGLVLKTDYTVDEKYRTVTLTEIGIRKVERIIGVKNLYETDFDTIHKIENALRAKALYEKDRDYVVKDGQVYIVDQFTGRILYGNRWSDGLHQAIEAKEGVQIQAESKTVATISYQNYFRLYSKLAGMTGTAQTEAEELFKIYSLDVISIPTNKVIARIDQPDLIFRTEGAKYMAIARDIEQRYKKGQPVLIGTVSVDKSQLISNYLKKLKIPHEILNAKNHLREALIISQAGKPGAVTVSTNMAGRGVDILLGGDPYNEELYKKVIDVGGLYVIGTERHESRRIDNQLSGRSGRQGDVGESRCYLSLQDDLRRICGGDRIERVMNTLRVDENVPIESKIISKAIESAQKKVEIFNYENRRSVVEYDDVMNIQRETIYSIRRKLLKGMQNKSLDNLNWIISKIDQFVPENKVREIVKVKIEKYGEEVWMNVITKVSLEVIDVMWIDHIDAMDDLRTGVRLRQYGQMDPLVEYKREGRDMFERLQMSIWSTVYDRLDKIEVKVVYENPVEEEIKNTKEVFQEDLNYGVADEAQAQNAQLPPTPKEPIVKGKKLGRNDPCWCRSGKKYKNCHWPN